MLLVVDAQRGFVPDDAGDVVRNINRCVNVFDEVVVTRFSTPATERYAELIGWNGIDDDALLPAVERNATRVIEKETYAAANERVLSRLSSADVYVAGFETDACILATAFALFDAGYRPIVIADACATRGGVQLHEAALSVLRRNIGAEQVVTTDSVIS